MFWGLIMEPRKRYTQTVRHSFHVSMAAIDVFSSSNVPVQVMCGFENRKYLLCTLRKNTVEQCSLDLYFKAGDKVTFLTNGESHVHLTGYLNEMDEEEEEEDELQNLGTVSPSNIVSGKRQRKRSCGELEPAVKKFRTMKLLSEVSSHDEDDSEDSDVHLSTVQTDDSDTSAYVEGEETSEDEEAEDEEGEDEEAEDEEAEDEEAEDEEAEDEEAEDEDGEDSDELEDENESDEASLHTIDDEDVESTRPRINGSAKKSSKDQRQVSKNQIPQKSPKQGGGSQKKTMEGGVIVEDVKVGSGPVAKTGKMVQVLYEGRFMSNNKMFDSCSKGNGFRFRLGKQEVIKGWDVGVSGMKVGGKRRIVCPPHMAYGAKGSPPTIPPNSTLVFEVELKSAN